jgi:hypothetical protein
MYLVQSYRRKITVSGFTRGWDNYYYIAPLAALIGSSCVPATTHQQQQQHRRRKGGSIRDDDESGWPNVRLHQAAHLSTSNI